jgi:hypothetical protein
MKRIAVIAIGLLASLAAVGSASAQDNQTKANIPFDFYVGNTWLPAGTYTMSSGSITGEVVKILSADKKNYIAALTLPDEARAGQGELVFHKIGDQYFLHEILCAASNMNVQLPTSKQEKRAVTREASTAPESNVYLALLN